MIRAEGVTKQFLCGFRRCRVRALAGLDREVRPGGGPPHGIDPAQGGRGARVDRRPRADDPGGQRDARGCEKLEVALAHYGVVEAIEGGVSLGPVGRVARRGGEA